MYYSKCDIPGKKSLLTHAKHVSNKAEWKHLQDRVLVFFLHVFQIISAFLPKVVILKVEMENVSAYQSETEPYAGLHSVGHVGCWHVTGPYEMLLIHVD